jgi:hypothetical protein
MTHTLRTLFACWLTVVATGTVVSHRHEPAPGQCPGCGWTSVASEQSPTEPILPHRHFVLLGIESGAIPEGAETGTEDSGRVEPAASFLAPVDGHADVPAADELSAPGFLPALNLSANVPGLGDLSASVSSCPHVTHARSGILRL